MSIFQDFSRRAARPRRAQICGIFVHLSVVELAPEQGTIREYESEFARQASEDIDKTTAHAEFMSRPLSPTPTEPSDRIIADQVLGRLHHEYSRAAART
jgi:hypothetical protein